MCPVASRRLPQLCPCQLAAGAKASGTALACLGDKEEQEMQTHLLPWAEGLLPHGALGGGEQGASWAAAPAQPWGRTQEVE